MIVTKNEIFELYKRVQQKDRKAEDQLIAEHKRRFPDSYYHTNPEIHGRGKSSYFRQDLHTMYLHLYR